jgi:16S rRNA (guanine527-N7)-methyltransferase
VAEPALLSEALASSQRLGMLGDRPIPEVIEHARAFVTALADVHGVVVDLGAGGGVPGLVIAHDRPDLRLVLIDRRTARTDHLRRLVGRLGWGDRVEVVAADAAAVVGRMTPADAAVARGFGPPLTTLTAAARLVVAGGLLVVSEPPDPDPTRWPAAQVSAAGWSRTSSPDPRVATFRRRST